MLRGAIFDFDGVIVDSHPVHKRAWLKFLESVGKTVDEEELQIVLDGRKREDILCHFLGEIQSEKVVEYGHRKEQFFRNEAADVRTIDGLMNFLKELEDAQLALAIASSGSRSRVEFLLGRLSLRNYFKVVVTGDEVERGKPDPSVFLKAAQQLEIDPADLVVFEDAVSGIKAAKAAGMKCVGITGSQTISSLRDVGADYLIPDFRPLSYARLREIFVAEVFREHEP